MDQITFPIQIRYTVEAIPPRCRKPRTYYEEETYQFSIRTIPTMPPLALEVKNSINPTLKYYFYEGKLYTPYEDSLPKVQKRLTPKQRAPHQHAPEEGCEIIESSHRERIGHITDVFSSLILVKETNKILEEAPEPAYQISSSFREDSWNTETHPKWGSNRVYRADQWEIVKKQTNRKFNRRPGIIIHIPEAIQGKINPQEPNLNPKGNSPEELFTALKETIYFHEEFSKDEQEYQTIQLTEPIYKDGIWKMALANTNSEEIRVILLEIDPKTKEPTTNGRIQQIALLNTRFTFQQEWKGKIRHLKDLVKSGSPENTEEDWKNHEKTNHHPKNSKDSAAFEKSKAIDAVIKLTYERQKLHPLPKENQNANEELALAL